MKTRLFRGFVSALAHSSRRMSLAACSSNDAAGRRRATRRSRPEPTQRDRHRRAAAAHPPRSRCSRRRSARRSKRRAPSRSTATSRRRCCRRSPARDHAIVVKPGSSRARAASRSRTSRRPTSRRRSPTIARRRRRIRNAKRIADLDSALFKNDALARARAGAGAVRRRGGRRRRRRRRSRACARSASTKRRSRRCARASTTPIAGDHPRADRRHGRREADLRRQLLQAGTHAVLHDRRPLSTMWVMANVFANDLPDVAVGAAGRRHHRRDADADPGQRRLHRVARRSGHEGGAGARRRAEPESRAAARHVRARADQVGAASIAASSCRCRRCCATNRTCRSCSSRGRTTHSRGAGSTLGTRVGDQYEVMSGLAAGDQVVADGALFLQFAESQ